MQQVTSSHRTRKDRKCDHCDRIILVGQTYSKVVTFPGEGSIPIGGGDYETVDWPFTVQIGHDPFGYCADYLSATQAHDEFLEQDRADERSACPSCGRSDCTFPPACQDAIGVWPGRNYPHDDK